MGGSSLFTQGIPFGLLDTVKEHGSVLPPAGSYGKAAGLGIGDDSPQKGLPRNQGAAGTDFRQKRSEFFKYHS